MPCTGHAQKIDAADEDGRLGGYSFSYEWPIDWKWAADPSYSTADSEGGELPYPLPS